MDQDTLRILLREAVRETVSEVLQILLGQPDRASLRELWQRGLRRVLLFITDGLPGMEEAIRRVYPLAQWQVCVVHRVRSSLAQVRSRDRALLIYGARSRVEALEALEKGGLGARYPFLVAAWWESSGALLRFYDYPQVLWPYLRGTKCQCIDFATPLAPALP
ncbi:hypothetical protein TthSNM33_09950 [Thermus thermophilus]|nr:hypothetical protein TthSNM33_09950 [Thermus thermophilus]